MEIRPKLSQNKQWHPQVMLLGHVFVVPAVAAGLVCNLPVLSIVQATRFKHVYNPKGTPQQRNGFDCGVFAVMCCCYVGADLPFDYGQEQVFTFLRAMVAMECYFQRLRVLA
jgi:hypothetical protein